MKTPALPWSVCIQAVSDVLLLMVRISKLEPTAKRATYGCKGFRSKQLKGPGPQVRRQQEADMMSPS